MNVESDDEGEEQAHNSNEENVEDDFAELEEEH